MVPAAPDCVDRGRHGVAPSLSWPSAIGVAPASLVNTARGSLVPGFVVVRRLLMSPDRRGLVGRRHLVNRSLRRLSEDRCSARQAALGASGRADAVRAACQRGRRPPYGSSSRKLRSEKSSFTSAAVAFAASIGFACASSIGRRRSHLRGIARPLQFRSSCWRTRVPHLCSTR